MGWVDVTLRVCNYLCGRASRKARWTNHIKLQHYDDKTKNRPRDALNSAAGCNHVFENALGEFLKGKEFALAMCTRFLNIYYQNQK